MTTQRLTPDLIEDTSTMQLILHLWPKAIEAHLIGQGPAGAELTHKVELADESTKALENAIYDNPLTLKDFNSIEIISHTHDFFLSPAEAKEQGEEMAKAMLPDGEGELLSDRATEKITIFFRMDADKYNFLKRTFAYATIRHTLAITAAEATTPGVHAECGADCDIDIVRIGKSGEITYLNHPETYSAADCAYYILAAMQPCDDIILRCIEPSVRERICELINQVSPDTKITPPAHL